MYVIYRIKYALIYKFLKLEPLTCMDTYFLYDDYRNRANIVAVGIYQKFDYKTVSAQFKERAVLFPRIS